MSRRLLRMTALSLAAALVFAACSNDDDSSSDDGDETIELAQDGSVLAAVQERGEVNCGVNDAGLPGFAVADGDTYNGFDADFCKAIAAAIFGDATKVNWVPLTAEQRFTALQAGDIDVLIRNTTWTASRDGTEGVTFLHTTFFDGQGMMVPDSSAFTTIAEMDGATVCVLSGTTTELNLATKATEEGITLTPLTFESNDELQPAYASGQCDGWTSDKSQLTAFASELDGQRIMEETFSKEPLGPAVADGDSEWAQIVDWTTLSPIQGEEFGISMGDVEGFTSDDPNVTRWLGQEDPEEGTVFDPGLGLPTDFNVQVIAAVGNYGEIYDRNLAPIGIPDRGVNGQWTNPPGLLYAPPYR